ncbi:hypothetical protein [Acinetobacter sp. ANC 3813]|uniref:hypothetical protein n=1 Tax=Acinetobacter sp. ANC 3813 TaxID=1977873 RepID=UPI000A33DA18|nr:hypothetical protein [Acinetobacter sp. ANC 3813]OTG87259.1 hypothetical protein B9T34_17010 [Acinetobacter sp. ANC 3813]
MLFNTTAKQTLLVTSIVALLTACGGGGGNSGSSTTTPFAPKTVSGAAVDFYLANADVQLDDCKDSSGNVISFKTDTAGKFNFQTTANCTSSAMTITGGTDIVTNLPFTGTLKLKKTDLQNLSSGSVAVTPLTSLQYYFEKSGNSAGLSTVLANLGLNISGDLSQYDPIQSGTAHDMAVIFVLQQLITQIEDNLQAISKDDGSNALTQEQATAIAFNALISHASTQPLFSSTSAQIDTAALANIVNNAVTTAAATINDPNVAIDSSLASQVTSSIENVSTAITALVANGGSAAHLQEALSNSPAALEEISNNLKAPLYDTFNLAGYSVAEVQSSSSTAPLGLELSNIDQALSLRFKLINGKSDLRDTFKVAFKVTGSRGSKQETFDVLVNNIQVHFGDTGEILDATIPAGTVIKFATTLSGVQSSSFTTTSDIDIQSAGEISLLDLIQSNPAFETFYSQYENALSVGDLVQITSYVSPTTYTLAPSFGLDTATVSIGGSSFKGNALTGYFKLN